MKPVKVEAGNSEDDMKALIDQYLDVCNQAIDKNKEKFPYHQALNLGETLMKDRSIDFAIYDDEPKAAFSLRFEDDKLKNDGRPSDVKKAWRVNLSYLRKVVDHPKDYIDHPEKLDLDWLKNRVGL